MNVELLDKISEHIMEEPKRVCMAKWVIRRSPGQKPTKVVEIAPWREIEMEFPKCDSICCIAGWAIVLSNRLPFVNLDSSGSIQSEASRLLEINDDQAEELFMPSLWPEPFRSDLSWAPIQSQQYAGVVVDRIQAFKEQYAA